MSEINGHNIKYYILNKNKKSKRIIAVTKETKSYIHGICIYNEEDPKKINKTVKLQKNLISKFIDEYDFTKTLSLD
tara:strand:- start:269 stop:496 length:228 start_codon:yes stop_codon:yes gene_type:complete